MSRYTFRVCVLRRSVFLFALIGFHSQPARAQNSQVEKCPRPAAGSSVSEPADLRSENGELHVRFSFYDTPGSNGSTRYCYIADNGAESPTLRVRPGDWLTIDLKNEISAAASGSAGSPHHIAMPKSCAGGGAMVATATNLHFHGLAIPPICHQDEVLTTSVLPSDSAYEYRVQIPANQPPGLYWYHPHLHGFSKVQVLGGASGALIVEGIERANPALAGLAERVIVIRDQDLLNPNAPPSLSDAAAPPVVLDPDGDARNTGSGTGKPAKDLSLNFVPVPYPNYERAVICIKPGERQLWRVLNASAITYLNLQMLFDGLPQDFGVVALDGVPINANGLGRGIVYQNHVGLPPGGRAEFIITGPAEGVKAELLTRSVNTGAGGENDPVRPLATIVASKNAAEPRSKLSSAPEPLPRSNLAWLGNVQPTHERKLYFTEKLQDPNDPNSPTTFYITVDGQQPVPFDPSSTVPNIIVRQGDVEDWYIENRSQELHAFHIHQIHFILLAWFGIAVNEPFLRDTINVPFWDGKTTKYPSVKLRMDFRNPSIIGTFPYHCHLLEHEDGGMMGLVRVEPRKNAKENSKKEPDSAPDAAANSGARVR
ncbi:MAG: multicopper oxidase domain-containing protein [Candidatus Acidiferrales bacterium]